VTARRLTSRDYKHSRRSPFDFARWRKFAAGLSAGLAVAGIVYVADHRVAEQPLPEDRPTPRKAATAGDPGAAPESEHESKFDFYEMLPKFEVVVPEKERGARIAPAAQVERPGVYFLQAGSYKNESDAERISAQLGKQGISATVQRVQVDADVWHRVRIGPIRDLGQLNRLRQQLQASDLDTLVIRVDD
jgi:cell division protein FtsN